jgi:serine/threonine protein kinase
MIGRKLQHYLILSQLGAGGMGVVYCALDEELDRKVALKVLSAGVLADEAARKQFRKEALALAKLNHPNIETIFEFSSQDGLDFLAMELIPGVPLNEKLKDGPMSVRDVMRFGVQMCDGLTAAHEQGVIHRDLKPSNLFVTGENRLKILDFGLAVLLRPADEPDVTRSITETPGGAVGTLPYMSPEQLRGEPTDARYLFRRRRLVRNGHRFPAFSANPYHAVDRSNPSRRACPAPHIEPATPARPRGRCLESAR